MTNVEKERPFVRDTGSSFVIRNSSFRAAAAFTIIELLIVMAIIIILAGLVLGISGYAHEKGARSRAEAEIAAMSAALESYKADNGIYPQDSKTDTLDARSHFNPDPQSPSLNKEYPSAVIFLYYQLSGDLTGSRQSTQKSYFSFSPGILYPHSSVPVTGLVDPFGNYYGYSTANHASSSLGYNPTYDLWSTGGETGSSTAKWIKNW